MFRKLDKLFAALALASFVFSINVAVNGSDAIKGDASSVRRSPSYGKKPVVFEQNEGQAKHSVRFISRASSYTLFLTDSGAEFSLKSTDTETQDTEGAEKDKRANAKVRTDTMKMRFIKANARPVVSGNDDAITKTNYYIGKSRFENISNYKRVNYKNIYDGIDAVFYGNKNDQLEYDFIVAPNKDAGQIGLSFDGASSVAINSNGDLVIKTATAEIVQQKPVAFQVINGERREIEAKYLVNEQREIGFALGEYDKSQSLTIDPVLDYLTYIGGTHCEVVDNVVADAQGNAFIVGATCSLDYPVPNSRSDDDFAVFVTKISADGSTILYNTFIDGRSDDGISDCFNRFIGNDIAIDTTGNVYITGTTDSADFPVTDNAYQRVRLCSRQFGLCIFPEEAYVAKLNTSGAILYSTFLGGRNTDFANGIAVDSAGKAYVTGGTHSGALFPTKNAYQGTGVFGSTGSNDAFMTVLNASGSDIVYSSGLGGNSYDTGNAIALDTSNNVYITGMTESENSFPTKNAFQSDNNGGTDAFVAKFNAALSGETSLIYSTFLGGVGTDQGNGIAVVSGQAHVVGVTGSVNFPLLNAFRSTNQINEAFVTVLSSTGASLVNSSFLGGSDQESARGVAVDASGNIYVTGNTLSNNFPTALAFQSARAGSRDAFVTKLKFGRGIISSSYLGGTEFDSGKGIAVRGNHIYVVGSTSSDDLATTSGVIRPTFGGLDDGFAAKILDVRLDSVGIFRPNVIFQVTQSITNLTNQTLPFTTPLSGARGVSGDFNGDGIDTTGSFTNGTWKTRDVNFPIGNFAPTQFNFGLAGDLPIVGDWNGDGVDTAGTYRPSTGQFFLTNTTNGSAVNNTQFFGVAEDLPVAGDWDGDGIDTIGVFRPSTGQFFLTNSTAASPTIDINVFFGLNGDLPFAGDFNGDGTDSIGVWRPSTAEFFITNNNAIPVAQFQFGAAFTDQPMVGDWDGRPVP